MRERSLPWVLASRNAGKLRELRALFASSGIAVSDLRDEGVPIDDHVEDAIESFESFEENALAKVRYFAGLLPGRTIIADDSGLAVHALGGAPGVRSKRWSGVTGDSAGVDAANNARLLHELRNASDRSAQFVCAAAWARGGDEVVARGEVPGYIVDDPRGMNGFGYDPHFLVTELGMTMAEAEVALKQSVSHRGRAFARLLALLREQGLVR